MRVDEIKVKEPFKDLFPIEKKVLKAVIADMKAHGFDPSQPIVTWQGVVIDGHTRLIAAKEVGITDVPVIEKTFSDEHEALEYAIHNQRNRRNMSDADILRCVEALDKRFPRGRNLKGTEPLFATNVAKNGKVQRSSQKTANILGISRGKVERARKILKDAPPELKDAVLKGQKSIHKAYVEVVEGKRAPVKKGKPKTAPVFNQTNENIDWAKWSWNPVTGCKHGCFYCYARDIANRFYEKGFEPTFWPERLTAPQNTKIPSHRMLEPGIRNVFVCSMGDLLGEWVPREWIEKVLKAINDAPLWTFIVLTKNPRRYREFEWPANCWLGATVDTQERADKTIPIMTALKASVPNVVFISCEPLEEGINLRMTKDKRVDWIIIGSRSKSSGAPARQPEWRWVERLLWQARAVGAFVYFKPNLQVVPREYPSGV